MKVGKFTVYMNSHLQSSTVLPVITVLSTVEMYCKWDKKSMANTVCRSTHEVNNFVPNF